MTSAAGVTVGGMTEASPRGPASLALVLGASAVETATAILPHSHRAVQVPVYVRHETAWPDQLPREFGVIPNKRAFVLDGVPYFPELMIVRLLERGGWGAAWRKSWNGDAYWRDVNVTVQPGALALTIVDQISRQAGYAGSWDILAWRGRELRLLSSRMAGGQRVSAFMADWLGAALRMGIPLGCFAVVEHHTPARPTARRR